MPLYLFCLIELPLRLYTFGMRGRAMTKKENFLKTILKLTMETNLNSSYNYVFTQSFSATIYSQVAISIKVGSEHGRPGGSAPANASMKNATTELVKFLAKIKLNVNTMAMGGMGVAEELEVHGLTKPELSKPTGASLPPVEAKTRRMSTNVQHDMRAPESLTVEELEEMLKKKRNANMKSQGKDNKEKKNTSTR